MSINLLAVSGKLARDSEVKTDKNGEEYLSFGFSRGSRKVGDHWEGGAWHNISAYGEWNLKMAHQLTKGKAVVVVGVPNTSAYEDKNGKATASVYIKAFQIECLDDDVQTVAAGKRKHSKFTRNGNVEESDTDF